MAPLDPDLYRIDNRELADRIRRASNATKRPDTHSDGPFPLTVELWTHEIGYIENLLRDDHAQLLDKYDARLDPCPHCQARVAEIQPMLMDRSMDTGPFALRVTGAESPEHPLYVPGDTEPVRYMRSPPCED